MVITNQPSPLYDTFIEPFHQGVDNISACFSGKRTERIFQQAVGQQAAETDLSLLDRVGSLVIGLLLLVPLINAVVFAILQAIDSSFVFQRAHFAPPAPLVYPLQIPGVPAAPGAAQPIPADEAYLQRRNEGVAIVPDAPVLQEPPATPEEYQRRKNAAIAQLPHYPERGHRNFECSHEVVQYDLDAILARFNGDHNPERLAELYDYCGFPQARRRELDGCIREYSRAGLNDQKRMTKVLLSKLFDFFQISRPLFQAGTEQEVLFKAQIANTFDRIIDSHRNCVDQVLSQMETIISDTIADFESIRGQGIVTLRDRIISRTAFTLFKYRAHLIRQICAVEYPDEDHMADMERLVKQRLAGMMGMQGGVFDVGAYYDGMIRDLPAKIENIVSIFLFGQASPARIQQDDQRGLIDDRITTRRRESRYDPEQYLTNALRTYHGEAKSLRNDILLWVRQHFNLAADDELTTNFVRAISEEPDALDASEGGNMTHRAVLFVPTEIGIFRNNNVVPAAAVGGAV